MAVLTPEPGIYHNVPFGDYLQWDAISNSRMQPALRSMAHYRAATPIEETPAMRLGTLVHTGRFEPERIQSAYVVMPEYEKQVKRPDGSAYDKPKLTAAYRELVDTFTRANIGKIIVTQSQWDDMCGMVAAMAADERATRYLTGGDYEVSVLAIDPVTGLACKGRCDHLHLRGGRIGDLKTTADASKFETVIADRSYHRQMAFYADMIEWLGRGVIEECAIVAVESSAPYGVRSAPLDDDAMEAGRDEYRDILDRIAKAVKSRRWEGYSSPKAWRLPYWKLNQSGGSVSLNVGGKRVDL